MFSTLLQPKPVEKYIQFEDKAVEAICVANWSSDGIGLTEEDAAAVTDIGLVFNKNTEIKRFNEFRYFVAVRSLRGNDNASNAASNGAFYGCSALQSIQFPPSLETINGGAFSHTTALAINVDVPSLKDIRNNAFRKSGITSITNLGTISELGTFGTINYGGEGVFYGCTNLTIAEIPSSVINIPAATFYNCSALTKIVCRATTPPTLGNYAFDGSTCPIYVPDASLEAYKTAMNWNSYADRIHPLSEIEGSPYIQFEDPVVEAICVANWSSDGIGLTKEDAAAVTSIGTTFKGNTEITSFDELQYFTGMTSIPKNAFNGCSNLKSCKISDSVTEIGNDAFATSGLESISAKGVETIGAYSFYSCKSLKSADFPNVKIIYSGAETYGSFRNCTALQFVNMPYVVTIGSASFNMCPIEGKMVLLYFERMGKDVFDYAKMTSFLAPKLKAIGNTSFYQCSNLETMLLRDVESIAGYSNYETFRDCTKLKHFICLAQSVPSLATNVFRGTPINDGTGAIYVLDAKVDAYKSAANWSAFANVIKPYSQLATDSPTLYEEIQQYL